MTPPAPQGSDRPALSLTVEPDAPLPRLRIVLTGTVRGDDVADAFIRLYEADPQTTLHDRLFDFTAYRSGFDLQHLKRVAPAYMAACPDLAHPCRTAFVTSDPNFHLWARAMGFEFGGRQFRSFSNFEDAERFLDEPLDRRPPPS